MLLDRWMHSKLTNIESGTTIDLGSDHRSLTATLCFNRISRRCNKKDSCKAKVAAPWPPKSLQEYEEKLAQKLEGMSSHQSVDSRHFHIQEALIEASQKGDSVKHAIPGSDSN
eukprot:2737305-Karenia_brevis.AAC.1